MTTQIKKIYGLIKYVATHPANSGNTVFAVIRLLRLQLSKRFLKKTDGFIFLYEGVKINIKTNEPSFNAMVYTNGLFDYSEMMFMKHFLRGGDNFLDVGANAGAYTFLARSIIGEKGMVHTFEPNQLLFNILNINVQNNFFSNIKLYSCAVSNRTGFSYFTNSSESSINHLCDEFSELPKIRVKTIRLDDIELTDLTLAKFDIEGGEFNAFIGADSNLRSFNPPVIIVELNNGPDRSKIIKLIENYGYNWYVYNVSTRKLEEAGEKNTCSINQIAIAIDHFEFVNNRVNQN
jgi:FkbM family methyltransferase